MHLKIFTQLTIVTTFLFFIINYIHLNFFVYDVFLYTSILDLIISISFSYGLFFYFKKDFPKKKLFVIATYFYIHFVTLLLFVVFFNVIIERSLSIYILEKISEDSSITTQELYEVIEANYLKDMDVVRIRIEEQTSSGNVFSDNHEIKLTTQGMFIVKFVSFYKKYYLNPSYLEEK